MLFIPLFHPVATLISVVLAIREAPAPHDAIHEYPVHAIPFNLENKVVPKLFPLDGVFHSIEPVELVV
jgi:hypothetical protein